MTATRIQAQPASNLVRTIPEGERVLPPPHHARGVGGQFGTGPLQGGIQAEGQLGLSLMPSPRPPPDTHGPDFPGGVCRVGVF